MGPIGIPEMSITKQQSMQGNFPEKRRVLSNRSFKFQDINTELGNETGKFQNIKKIDK